MGEDVTYVKSFLSGQFYVRQRKISCPGIWMSRISENLWHRLTIGNIISSRLHVYDSPTDISSNKRQSSENISASSFQWEIFDNSYLPDNIVYPFLCHGWCLTVKGFTLYKYLTLHPIGMDAHASSVHYKTWSRFLSIAIGHVISVSRLNQWETSQTMDQSQPIREYVTYVTSSLIGWDRSNVLNR